MKSGLRTSESSNLINVSWSGSILVSLMNNSNGSQSEEVDVFVVFGHTFGRHLQHIVIAENILPFAFGMWLGGSEELHKVGF